MNEDKDRMDTLLAEIKTFLNYMQNFNNLKKNTFFPIWTGIELAKNVHWQMEIRKDRMRQQFDSLGWYLED